MNAAAMYPFIVYVLIMHVPFFKRHQTSVTVLAGILIALIGISRIYLGVHYTTDVIGGFSSAWRCFSSSRKLTKTSRSFDKSSQRDQKTKRQYNKKGRDRVAVTVSIV
ncbi:phosphatase PAP2 family protein [Bacillus sonorensis]|nr:phosphatase PAP2 family protein [Bacillus sonorensis]